MQRPAMIFACQILLLGTATAQEIAPEPVTTPPPVRYLAFSPDSQTLGASTFIQGKRGEFAAWNRSDWQIRIHYSERVGFPRFAFSPNGEQLVLARLAPELKLLNARTGEIVGELKGHQGNARGVCYIEQGKKIVSGSEDRTIKIWDANSQELTRSFDEHFTGMLDIAAAPNDRRLITADMPDSYKAHLWDLDSQEIIHTFEPFGSLISHVSFSTDGKFVTIASWGGNLQVCDAETGEVLRNISGIGGANCGAISPDGRWIAVAAMAEQLYVFPGFVDADEPTKTRVGELLVNLDNDSYPVREEASSQLAALGAAAVPALQDARSSSSPEVRWRARRLLKRMDSVPAAIQLSGHQTQINCVGFSPDGELLASGDQDGVIKVWHVGDWAEVKTLNIPWRELPPE